MFIFLKLGNRKKHNFGAGIPLKHHFQPCYMISKSVFLSNLMSLEEILKGRRIYLHVSVYIMCVFKVILESFKLCICLLYSFILMLSLPSSSLFLMKYIRCRIHCRVRTEGAVVCCSPLLVSSLSSGSELPVNDGLC